VLAQPVDERSLGAIPAFAALGAQPSRGCVGEAQHVAVGQLAPRRVEIAAQDAGPSRHRGEIGRDRLVRADLRQLGRGRDRRVQVDHLDTAGTAAQHALGPRHSGRGGQALDGLAGRGEHAERSSPRRGGQALQRGLAR